MAYSWVLVKLHEIFNAKVFLIEEIQRYFLTHPSVNKDVHTFPKMINPKVNVIARLKFELAYDNILATTPLRLTLNYKVYLYYWR